MKKRIAIILLTGVLSIFLFSTLVQATFPDIQGHKYQEAIEFIQSRKIVAGYPDGSYRPNNPINRAELLTIIVGQKYKNLPSKDCFTDIKSDRWYAKFVCKGRELGIVAGYNDGSFKPAQDVNFVEVLIMLQRANNVPVSTSISPWYKNSVNSASEMNIIPLDIDSFDEKITRGQMAEMMIRILKHEDETLDQYLDSKKDFRVVYEDIQNHTDLYNQWKACQEGISHYCRGALQVSTQILSKPILTSPTNNISVSPASGNILFVWNVVQNATSYDLILSGNNGMTATYSAGNNTEYDIDLPTLSPISGQTTAYSWKIRANGPINFTVSNQWSFTITMPDIIAPQNSPSQIPKDLICFDAACIEKTYDFLIVTRSMFVSTLDEYVTWKKNNGFRVGLMTADYIDTSFFGENIARKIKNAIMDGNNSAGVRYVLLIGDTDINYNLPNRTVTVENVLNSYNLSISWNLPTMYYDRNPSGDGVGGTHNITPSDLPYTTFYDWVSPPIMTTFETSPADFGYLSYSPQVYLGRWPVKTVEELAHVVYKTMNFQPMTKINFFSDKALIELSTSDASHPDCPFWPPRDPITNTDSICMTNTNLLLDNLFGDVVGTIESISITSASGITSVLNSIWNTPRNSGVLENFHGDGPLAYPILSSEIHFENIFPLFLTASCYVTDFYSRVSDFFPSDTEVLSEMLLRNEKGPAAVVFPGSFYHFFKNILEHKTVGEAFYAGAELHNYAASPYVLFGDPSVKLM